MRWVRAFLLGLLPTALIGGLFVGGAPVDDPATILLTGGFLFLCPMTAIVAWPAAFIVGFLIMGLYRGFRGHRADPAKVAADVRKRAAAGLEAARTASSKVGALDDFVREALRRGTQEGEVIRMLTANGWSETDVRDALGRTAA